METQALVFGYLRKKTMIAANAAKGTTAVIHISHKLFAGIGSENIQRSPIPL